MMKYERPASVTAGDLLWCSIAGGASVAVEVMDVKAEQAEIRFLASDDTLTWVPTGSLYLRRRAP